jgi:hypothetical protein
MNGNRNVMESTCFVTSLHLVQANGQNMPKTDQQEFFFLNQKSFKLYFPFTNLLVSKGIRE